MPRTTDEGARGRHRSWPRLAGALVLAGACFAAYWGWLGWDRTYQRDPVTGVASGPYEAWQVVGCVLTLTLVTVVAGLVRQAVVAMVVMPLAFTVAWSIPARASDDSGLWGVGAILVLMGTAAGVCIVAPLSALVGSRRARGQHGRAGGAAPRARFGGRARDG